MNVEIPFPVDNEDQIHSSLSWFGQVFFHPWSLHPHPWNFKALPSHSSSGLLFCTGSLPRPLLWAPLMQIFLHWTCKTPLCKGIFSSWKWSGQGFCILTLCTVSPCERREEGTDLSSPKPLCPLLSHLRSHLHLQAPASPSTSCWDLQARNFVLLSCLAALLRKALR